MMTRMIGMKKLTGLLALGILLPLSAENLFQGDTGAEAGIDFVTLGGYGSKLVPAVQDTKVAYEGKASVRVDWVKKLPFGNTQHWTGQYIGVNTPELENDCDYTVSFYAKACTENYPLNVHIFSAYQWSKKSSYYLKTTLSKEWKRYEFTFQPHNVRNAPTKMYTLNLQFPRRGDAPDGPVWFDAFQIEKGKKATPYVSGQPAAIDQKLKSDKVMDILGLNDKIESVVNAVNLKDNGKTNLELTVCDWQGKILKKYTVPFTETLKKSFELPTDRYGWFMASARIVSGNTLLAEQQNTYIVVRPPVKLAPGCLAYMGVIADFDCYTEDSFKANRAMGASRFQLHALHQGHLFHTVKGVNKYDFTGLDRQVDAARKYGLAIKLGGLSPFDWPRFIFPKEEAAAMTRHTMLDLRHRDMYCDFIKQVLDRCGDKIETFDLGCEDNGRLGINEYFKKKYPEGVKKDKNGTPWVVEGPAFDALCTLLIDAAKIIRERYPDARVACIRPSQGRPGDEWFFVWKEFERIGRYFNSFSIDTYSMSPYYVNYKTHPKSMRSGGGPDGRFVTAKHAQSMIDKYGSKGQDIFLSETGLCLLNSEPELSPARQEEAEYTVRDMIAARCAGFTSYDLFKGVYDYPCSVNWGWSANGLRGMHIRAAAYSALAQFLENVVKTKWMAPDKVTRLAFLKHADGTGVCAVWAQKGYTLCVPEGLKVYEIMGNKFELPKDRILELSEAPYYLTHKNYDVLVKKLEKPVVDQSDFCSVAFRRKTIDKGVLKFINNSNTEVLSLDAIVNVDGGKEVTRVLDIPAASWNSIVLDVPPTAKSIDIRYRREGSEGKYVQTRFELQPYTAVESGSEPKSEMGSVKTRSEILPDEPWTPWTGEKDLNVLLLGSWDSEYLHLKAIVNDDRHFPSGKVDRPWAGDSMQIGIDPKNNGGFYQPIPGRYLDMDDYEIGFMLTADKRLIGKVSVGDKSIADAIRTRIERDEQAGTTVYTLNIPWSNLGVKPFKGMTFGFSAVFFDDDTGKGNECCGFIGSGITGRKNPMKFKKFYLK